MAHHGQALKQIIERSNYTIDEVSKKLGITRKTLYNWFDMIELPMSKVDRVGGVIGVDVHKAAPTVFGPVGSVKIVKGETTTSNDMSDYWKDKYINTMEDNLRLKDELTKVKEDLRQLRQVTK